MFNEKNCFFIFLLIFSFSFTSFAADRWTWVDSNSNDTTYVDLSSIKMINDEYGNKTCAEAWIKQTYSYSGGQERT